MESGLLTNTQTKSRRRPLHQHPAPDAGAEIQEEDLPQRHHRCQGLEEHEELFQRQHRRCQRGISSRGMAGSVENCIGVESDRYKWTQRTQQSGSS